MIEADFQREYDLDILAEIKSGMSWRRFLVLLGNLGPQSVLVNISQQKDEVFEGKQADDFLKSW